MKKLIGILSLPYKLYVGIVFVTLMLLLYPFFLIVLSRKKWYRHSFVLFVIWSYLIQLLTLVFVVRLNRVKIPKGPFVIVSNHSSYYDIFLMYSVLPHHRFLFMGKSEILSYPMVKRFFKDLNIPVFRKDRRLAAKSFIQAKQSIQDGWSIMLFPEGGIPDDDKPQMIPFKDGAFKMAKSAKVPIVLLTFLDNYHIFSDPDDLNYAHPGISRVVMHPVISKEEVMELSEEELSKRCFDTIAEPLRKRGLMK